MASVSQLQSKLDAVSLKLASGLEKTLARAITSLSTTSIRHTLCHLHRKNVFVSKLQTKLSRNSGRFVEYLLERADVKPAWKEHTEHAFLQKLANGTLAIESFKNYLIQDYLYLVRLRLSSCPERMLIVFRCNTLEQRAWLATSSKTSTILQL